MGDLPTHTSDITPEWLSNALSNSQTKVTVTSVNIKGGMKTGDNFSSQLILAEIAVKYNEISDNLSIVIKRTPESDEMKFLLSKTRAFYKEIDIYSKVIPDLINMQYPKPNPIFPKVPRYYYGKIEDGNAVMIMDNMNQKGFIMHRKQSYFDDQHVKLVLGELAKFHGLAHVKIQSIEPTKAYPHVAFVYTDKEMFNVCIKGVIAALELIKDVPGNASIVNKLIDHISADAFYEQMNKLRTDFSHPMLTIAHGDMWNNNLLFYYDDEEKVRDVCFIDWQMSTMSSPFFDLVYFLFAGTSAAYRKENLECALREYYNEFFRVIRTFPGNHLTEQEFTFDNFHQEFQSMIIVGAFVSIILQPLILSETVGSFTGLDNFEESITTPGANESESTKKLIFQRINDLLTDTMIINAINNI